MNTFALSLVCTLSWSSGDKLRGCCVQLLSVGSTGVDAVVFGVSALVGVEVSVMWPSLELDVGVSFGLVGGAASVSGVNTSSFFTALVVIL